MRKEYVLARNRYQPCENIKFLLVAESPPASGGYFYFDKATGRDSLFRETMKALRLFPEDGVLSEGFDKGALLKEFQLRGFFVLDTSYEPVNEKSKKERKIAIMKEIPRLVADIRELNPERIVIVKASIFAPVKHALEKAGFAEKILNERAVPFPSHGWQKIYRRMLRELVAS